MVQPKRYIGKWWLPNHEKEKVSGTLYVEEDGRAYLETIGLFDEDFIHITSFEVIWGITDEMLYISIFNCRMNIKKNLACPFSVATYSTHIIAIGKKHLHSLNESGNYDVCAYIDELNYWYRSRHIHPNNMLTHIDVDGRDKNPIIAMLNDTTTLRIAYETEQVFKDCGLNFSISQYNSLSFIHTDSISVNEAKKELFAFQQFLSFASLSRVQYKHFYLIDKDLQNNPDCSSCKIEIIEQQDVVSPFTKYWKYVFDYDVIKDYFQKMIKEWFTHPEMTPIRNFLIDSVCGKDCYTSTRFLMITQAINGYYCRFKNCDVGTRKWLTFMKDQFSTISKMDELSPEDLDIIRDTRDVYSHLLSGDEKQLADDQEMRRYIFILRKYLICCILSLLGLNNFQIGEIFQKSDNPYLYPISHKSI